MVALRMYVLLCVYVCLIVSRSSGDVEDSESSSEGSEEEDTQDRRPVCNV